MESGDASTPYRVPPRVRMAPPPVPRRGGCGWMMISLILAGMLAITWIGILATSSPELARTGANVTDYWEEHLLEAHDADNRVAVIEVAGLISSLALDPSGMNMVDAIKDQLTMAKADDSVLGVILKIDSPGGEVLASDEIYREIQAFQSESGKPVVASMSGLAASGGYYVAAPCRWIVAHELTITGSIGVILHSYNYRGLMDKVGIMPRVFKSGRFKDMLSGEKSPDEILPETQAMMQALIDETFDRFKGVVSQGRSNAAAQNGGTGKSLDADWQDYADGRILTGRQAFELGFVDELGNFEQATDRMGTIIGVPEFDLITYRQPFSFGNFFRLLGKNESKRIELDLGFDVPHLQVGRLYFLAANYIL